MDLFEQVSNDIKEAMKARDKVRLMTLRNIKKVFLEAKTAPGANDTANGRADLAEEELAQAAVIESYLPKQLSATEIEEIVKGIIAETGASSMKDMGRVMGIATKQLAGKADGGAVSQIVKRLLA